jgi:hypothetical protein
MWRNSLPPLYVDNWIFDFLFCIEATEQKAELYISLQRATYFDTEMFHIITVGDEAAVVGTASKDYDTVVITEKPKFPLMLRITRLFNFLNSIQVLLSRYTQVWATIDLVYVSSNVSAEKVPAYFRKERTDGQGDKYVWTFSDSLTSSNSL